MSSSIIHQPHDKFFKLSMGEYRVAYEFFSEHLPSTILTKIDLTTLKLENHSFIDENYKSSEADIIYSAKMANVTGYLFLLCEHQSTVDQLIAFRLWMYINRLMEMHIKQNPNTALPFIYPLIIYTGQENWDAPLDFFSLFGEHQTLAREWLLKPFHLFDIHKANDDEMIKRRWSGLVEFALKYRQAQDFKKFLQTLLPWVHEIEKRGSSGFSLGKNVLKYVLDGTVAKDFDLFAQSVQAHLSTKLGDEMTTMAQELMRRGQEKGIVQGVHQGEAAMIIRQLNRRFHQVPESYLSQIQQADAETLLVWGERILEAKTLEEVFE